MISEERFVNHAATQEPRREERGTVEILWPLKRRVLLSQEKETALHVGTLTTWKKKRESRP